MAARENVARYPRVHADLVSLILFDKDRFIERQAIPQTLYAIGHREWTAPWIDIDDFRRKIGIVCRSSNIEYRPHRPRDLEIFSQRRRRVDQDILAHFDRGLIER